MAQSEMPEKLIESITASLEPFYADDSADSAQQMGFEYPSSQNVVEAQRLLLEMLLPSRSQPFPKLPKTECLNAYQGKLRDAYRLLQGELVKALPYRFRQSARQASAMEVQNVAELAQEVAAQFFSEIPAIRYAVIQDIQAAYMGDPAAHSYAEVILAYPGIFAIASHRVAHTLYTLDVPLIPRIMSEWSHTQTGADIHPGARIGGGFFIDHPTGVVVGETARIGNKVKLYQGVTIGAKSFPVDENGHPIKHIQRHPTVEDEVVIYANATILGGDTVIGARSIIGGNVFLMESVAPGSMVSTQSSSPRIKISG